MHRCQCIFVVHGPVNMTTIQFLIVFIIVIRNGKVVWKHGTYCSYFLLNLKYLGWPYKEYIQTVKNCLVKNDFEAVLTTFCSYDYGVNASEEVEKIKNGITNAPRFL